RVRPWFWRASALGDEDRARAADAQRLFEWKRIHCGRESGPALGVPADCVVVHDHPAANVAPLDSREVAPQRVLAVLASKPIRACRRLATGEIPQLLHGIDRIRDGNEASTRA